MIWLSGFVIGLLICMAFFVYNWHAGQDERNFIFWCSLISGYVLWALFGGGLCATIAHSSETKDYKSWEAGLTSATVAGDDGPTFIRRAKDSNGYDEYTVYLKEGNGFKSYSVYTDDVTVFEGAEAPKIVSFSSKTDSSWWPWDFYEEDNSYQLYVPEGTVIK